MMVRFCGESNEFQGPSMNMRLLYIWRLLHRSVNKHIQIYETVILLVV
jgi:hypothetical protein